MAKTYVPVNSEVVRWAVDESGLSVEEIAQNVKVEPAVLERWIEGIAQPSRGEFTRLVEALRRPSALFFVERVPASSPLPESLRSARGQFGHTLTQEERRWVRRALRLQKLVGFLVRQRVPPPRDCWRLAVAPEVASARPTTAPGVRGLRRCAPGARMKEAPPL